MPYTRIPLTGSTHGRGIKIAATASAGDTIHSGQPSATLIDVVTIYAYNSSTANVEVTLQWGGTTSVDDDIKVVVPPRSGLVPIVVDAVIRNSLDVLCYAQVTNVITIHGFVNRSS